MSTIATNLARREPFSRKATAVGSRNRCPLALAFASVLLLACGSPLDRFARAEDEVSRSPNDVADQVDGALALLEEARQDLGKDIWAQGMRELILLGHPAVPELSRLLEQTDDQYRMRCIVFALRGIGDRRVIPLLIRTIPKTLQPPASDYGLRCEDPELMAFMRRHDKDIEDRRIEGYERYSFGRPVSEVMSTLQQWTGRDDGLRDISFVFRRGGLAQQSQQEQLYSNVARRWAAWWSEHWREYVDDPALARIDLPEHEAPRHLTGIPTGPAVTASSEVGLILASILEHDPTLPANFVPPSLIDLDTGRFAAWPESFPPAGELSGREPELAAWAAREGIDLMGTQWQPPGSSEKYYVVRPFGLRAWQIDNQRYESIAHELRTGQIVLGTPADGYLVDFDVDTKSFRPDRSATFLFVTREGSCGVLQVVRQVTRRAREGDPSDDESGLYFGVRVESRLLYIDETLEQ